MGVLDMFRRKEEPQISDVELKRSKIVVGADGSADTTLIQTFSNTNITLFSTSHG